MSACELDPQAGEKMGLRFESLEPRDTPTAFVGIEGGTLAVVLVGSGSHAAVLSGVPGGPLTVSADFGTWTITRAVTQVVVIGATDGPNTIIDTADIPAIIVGGSKADALIATSAKTTIFTGGGADIVVATADSFVVFDPTDLVVRVPAPVVQPVIKVDMPATTTTSSPAAAPVPTFGAPSFMSLFGGLTPG